MSASSKKLFRKEQKAAEMTERQLKEQKEAKKLKTYTVTFSVVMVLVLVLALGIAGLTSFNNSGIAQRNTHALTIGEHQLNNADLNYFFVDQVYEYYNYWADQLGNYTYSYLKMMGLDIMLPLDEQVYDFTANTTYADYFTDLAVEQAVADYATYDLAKRALTEAEQSLVDSAVDALDGYAAQTGYSSGKAYLKSLYGPGATLENYRNYLTVQAIVQAYRTEKYDSYTYDAEVLETYNKEHYNEFSSFSYVSFYVSADAHMDCTAAEGDTNHTHTEDEKAAALKAAEAAANSLLSAGVVDGETMDAAIKKLDAYAESTTAKSSTYTNQLYTQIPDGDAVAQWLAGDRLPGEIGVVPHVDPAAEDAESASVLGYYVVLLLSRTNNMTQLVDARHILISFKGGVTDSSGQTIYSEAEKQTALAELNIIKKSFEQDPTEETFAELATIYSTDDGSKSNGGLYEDIYPGQMVPTFNDWCFDATRKAGDYDIVETEYGYHLIYFVRQQDTTYRDYLIENTLRNADYEAWYASVEESAKYTTNDLSKLSRNFILSNQ